MKKLLLFLTMSFFIFSPLSVDAASKLSSLDNDEQAKIAIFIHLDPNGISDPTKSSEFIFNDVKTEFEEKNSVFILSYDKSSKIFRNYIRENAAGDTVREGDLGAVIKRKDLMALAKDAQVDYVMYINARITSSQMKFNMWTGIRNKQTIVTDILLIAKDSDEYIIDEMFSDSASSGGTSFDRAFNKTLRKLLDKIDVSKIEFKKIINEK